MSCRVSAVLRINGRGVRRSWETAPNRVERSSSRSAASNARLPSSTRRILSKARAICVDESVEQPSTGRVLQSLRLPGIERGDRQNPIG